MHPLVQLAKKAVENFVKERKIIEPDKDLPDEFLSHRSGVFVTIERNNKLRGCIGTYLPTRKNIAQEVIRNAIAAATEDYRFGQMEKEELSSLSYTVYLLSALEQVKETSELNPKKYGIIVNTAPISSSENVVFNGHVIPKRGLLLPNLEGIDTVQDQVSIACQKAGINIEKEKILIYKFAVKKYK